MRGGDESARPQLANRPASDSIDMRGEIDRRRSPGSSSRYDEGQDESQLLEIRGVLTAAEYIANLVRERRKGI